MSARSVLLVSADVKLQRSLQGALLRNGIQCYASISLENAVRTLRGIHMDAVIVDAGGSGKGTPLVELTRAFPTIPRILITAGRRPRDTALATSVLLRPLDMSELLGVLRSGGAVAAAPGPGQ